jgi:uncharacterized repeat protein (TIGR03803 family)
MRATTQLHYALTNPLAILAVILLLLAPAASAAPKFKVLHNFGAGNDGGGLWSTVVFDRKGNLYGGTAGGGIYGDGAVFELAPASGGRWKESVIHSFSFNTDGASSYAPLSLDATGSLYGDTTHGGAYLGGTVFKLTPGSKGWTSTVLYEVGSKYGDVILDQAGNLYGQIGAGKYGAGAIAELSPGSDGWTYKILHSFCRYTGCPDGELPSNLIWDASGNLYGTAFSGGYVYPKCDGCGTVFELSPQTGGGWKDHTLHKFGAFHGDGVHPSSGLLLDSSGNLYGATDGGSHTCGEAGCGTVFKVTPGADGWKETILYNFEGGPGGYAPLGPLVFDKAGNLYGTTAFGGSAQCGCGVVFKLTPGSNGKWKYTRLHAFIASDGYEPAAGLIIDSRGNLYGTTAVGGKYGGGVVFEITP